jgi:Sec-independent protein translocase protein TatA
MNWPDIGWTDLFVLGLMALMWWAAGKLQEIAKNLCDRIRQH